MRVGGRVTQQLDVNCMRPDLGPINLCGGMGRDGTDGWVGHTWLHTIDPI
jgi:hypothetical protein